MSLDKWHISDMAADYVYVGDHDINFEVPGTLGVIFNYKTWITHKKGYPYFTTKEYLNENLKSKKINMIHTCFADLSQDLIEKIKLDKTAVLLIDSHHKNGIAEQRRLFIELMCNDIMSPVVIGRAYKDLSQKNYKFLPLQTLGLYF